MRLLFILIACLVAPMVQACGAKTDCTVGERIYRVSLPETGEAPNGALVWAHGYRGSAAGVMRNGSLRRMVHSKGMALIALQGVGGTWDLPKGPRTFDSTGAAEFDYVEDVLTDAMSQFDINTDRIIASGFSAGGMLVWNLACARPERFAGFIPYSGTFWLEPQDNCVTPVKSLVHIHGNNDSTVPLTGRPIGNTHQGNVAEALTMYTVLGNFTGGATRDAEGLGCSRQTNAEGAILEFCIFEGGHSFRTELLGNALDQF